MASRRFESSITEEKVADFFFILGVVSLIYPVGMNLLMLISVCMGLGPVAG
ncbi:MAG: hypothetical protein PUF16_08985 [Lachnospiraceae bacterium]|nr:hypothetical protein [Lachnospiraceae bacterium]